MLKHEWKSILKKPLTIGTIIAIMLVPMLYSLIFLSAFWNPYNKTERLSVAVINNDKGTEFNDKKLNVGKEFVDSLKDNNSFKWVITNKKDAMSGLKDENYYLVIEIPKDFSKNASTLMDKNPQKMKLNYYTNAGKSYVGAQIGSNAIKEINNKISKEVTEQYANSVFNSFKDIGEGMQKATDGANKLNNGATKISDGTNTLTVNLKKLKDSTLTFENGSTKLQSGAIQLSDGINQSYEGANQLHSGLNTLEAGAGSLKSGSGDLSNGLGQLVAGSKKLEEGSKQLEAGNEQINNGLSQTYNGSTKLQNNFNSFANNLTAASNALKALSEDLASNSNSLSKEELQAKLTQLQAISKTVEQLSQGGNQLENGLNQIVEGQNNLYQGSNKVLAGQKELNSNLNLFNDKLLDASLGAQKLSLGSNELFVGVQQLNSGSAALSSGLNRLDTGGSQLVDGINQLSDGSKKLTEGTGKLYNGSETLLKGTKDLSKGTNELHQSMKDGGDEVNKIDTNDETNKFFANPTKLVAHKLNNINEYGAGLTPYILSIGLFAGGLMFTSVYPMRKNATKPTTGLAWFTSKYSVLFIVGIFQAIFADLVLIHGLGFHVENKWIFYLFTIITSLTFLALIQFLTVAIGKVGQYLTFVMMLLQIGGSSGTFPVSLTPTFFQTIHPYLPMTYAIKGFREIADKGMNVAFVWKQATVLGSFALTFILLTILVFSIFVKKGKQFITSEA